MSDTGAARYDCQTDGLPGVEIRVATLRAVEALDAPYRVELELALADPDAEAAALLGKDMAVKLSRAGTERYLTGLVSELTLGERDEQMQSVQVVLEPAFALLALRRNTRMFQGQTVPEILAVVLEEGLGPYGRSFTDSLEETYEPREYCLQYQESDLAFVQRLMEEEGIAYHFEHGAAVEELRLTDRNETFTEAVTSKGDGLLGYAPHNAPARDEDPVHLFELRLDDTATAVTVAGFDWTQSAMRLEATAEGEDAHGRVRERYEHGIGELGPRASGAGRQLQIGSYDEGVRRYQKHDAERQAPLRQEEAVGRAVVGSGISRAVGLTAGQTVVLSGHPGVGMDGEYLLTRVEHFRAPPELGGVVDTDPYHNRFECVPLETVHRPARRTPKPRIHGVEPAIVTGPSGEEIHVDEHGRIKVQFSWDRENPDDETSSCWIRVKQEWAGASWGFWWVPRIGMEVVVHFVDGDPDRPLVTGTVYDGANATPYPLPDEKTKSTIKSDSSLGHTGFSGAGYNELRFEDAAGSEEIYAHAEKDYNEVVENDHNTLVHHDQTNTVDNNQTQTVHVDQTERVDVDQTMTVGANRTVHVKTNYDETVDGTETRNVAGDVSETFNANETRDIGANVTEDIGANETRDVGANQTEDVGADQTVAVVGSATFDVGSSVTRTVDGGITVTTPGTVTSNIAADWTVETAGAMTVVAPAGVTLTIPGGVQRADYWWGTIVSTRKTAVGNIEYEDFHLKNGVCSFAMGFWAVKIDTHVIDEGVTAVNMVVEGLLKLDEALNNEKAAGDAECAAAEVVA